MTALSPSASSSHEIPTKAQQCRRNAGYCNVLAIDAEDPISRARLLAMEQAWLALALNEEWLDGTCNPHKVIILPLAKEHRAK